MHPTLEDQLQSAFPKLYRKGAYCECHDGWFLLIWRLSAHLEELIAQAPEPEQDAYFADQVKEKYGQLRFYLYDSTEEMFQATQAASRESEQICELCGTPGTLLCDRGWFMTRCPLHTPVLSQQPAASL